MMPMLVPAVPCDTSTGTNGVTLSKVITHLVLVICIKKSNEAIEDADAGTNCHVIPMPVPVASHDQKTCVALHLDHPNLTNVIVPLTMPSAPHAANTGGISIT